MIRPRYGDVVAVSDVTFGVGPGVTALLGPNGAGKSTLLKMISGLLAPSSGKIDLAGKPARGDVSTYRKIGLVAEQEQIYPFLTGREFVRMNAILQRLPDPNAAAERTIALVREQGATVREVSLPHSKYAVPTYYIVAPAEAASNLARFDGVRYGLRRLEQGDDVQEMYRRTRGAGFGPEVRRRILVGTYVLSAGYYDAYYGKAQTVRALISDDFRKVFESGVDLLLTPTTPTPAFKAGEKTDDPVAMYYADIFVCAINLSGLPAISIPVGRTEGLPVGAQLVAPMFDEERMIGVASLLERHIDAAAEVR